MGACNFYRRHIHNFTYSSAPLTDLIQKTTPWTWTARKEECFQELKKKIAPCNCLEVPRPKGEIVLITDTSDVGGGVERSTNGRGLTQLGRSTAIIVLAD